MKQLLLFLVMSIPGLLFGQSDDLAAANTTRIEQPGYELVSFVAEPFGNEGILLAWSTGGEPADVRFVVQRSMDRMNWRNVYEQAGESQAGYTHYRIMDVTPSAGIAYYRLFAYSGTGLLDQSDEFAVEYTLGPPLRFVPEGRPGQFMVEADGPIADVQLLNNRGQFVPMQLDYTGQGVRVQADGLEAGAYYVQAIVAGKMVMRPITVTATGVIGG